MASTVKTVSSPRAAATSPPLAVLTTTPTNLAPKEAAAISRVVDGSNRMYSQEVPIPAPVTNNASAQIATIPIDALACWVVGASPEQTLSPAASAMCPITRGLRSDTLTGSPIVQPNSQHRA